MRKKLLIIIFGLTVCFASHAETVSSTIAKQKAAVFLNQQSESQFASQQGTATTKLVVK